jgi:transposase-like protein
MVDRVIHKQSVTCKFCSSPDIVKYGTFHGMQRYFCKSCRRKFADNDALPKMKTPIWIISLSLNCYYNGMSLAAVQREINQRHGAYYAQSSIYNWIMRFSGEAVRRAARFQPVSGDSLFFSVTPVISGMRRLYFLDIFDVNSKYLLASKITETNTVSEIISLIHSTVTATNAYHPVTIRLANACADYDTEPTTEISDPSAGLIFNKADLTIVKEFSSLLKKRARVVRNFKSMKNAQTITGAWRIHYNYFMENSKSKPEIPPELMGQPPFRKWEDIIGQS